MRLRTLVFKYGVGRGGGAAQSPVEILLSKFAPAPTTPDMAVVYRTPSAVEWWDLYQRIDDTYYGAWTIKGSEASSLRVIRLGYCVKQVLNTDAGVVRTGTWTGPTVAGGTDPLPFGDYYRTTTAGDTASYTTPAGMTIVGFAGYSGTNSGIVKVDIDGDATLANLCETAQDIVDSGRAANTILVANGGSLNPTDRVVDMYQYAINERIILADNLSPGAHAVVLTCTGYKNSLSSDVRFYLQGFLYGGASINSATANTDLVCERRNPTYLAEVDSVLEYALNVSMTTADWTGNGHGNETITSVKVYIDSVETALANEYTSYRAVNELKIERIGTLTHPDVTPALVGNTEVNFILTPNSGVKVTVDIDWLDTLTVLTGYMPMLAFIDAIDKGSLDQVAADYVVAGDPGADAAYGESESEMAYAWDADGSVGLAVYVPASSVDNWQYSTDLAWLQDRNGGALNKFYFTRWNNKEFNNGDSIASEFTYFIKHFSSGADAALAR